MGRAAVTTCIVVCTAVTVSIVVVPNAEHDRLPFPTLPLLPDTPRAPPTMDNNGDDHSGGHGGDGGGGDYGGDNEYCW